MDCSTFYWLRQSAFLFLGLSFTVAVIIAEGQRARTGLTGEECSWMSECAGDLVCAKRLNKAFVLCGYDPNESLRVISSDGKWNLEHEGLESDVVRDRTQCFCSPMSDLKRCTNSSVCLTGEACMYAESQTFCLSCVLLEDGGEFELVNSSDDACKRPGPTIPSPSPSETPYRKNGTGLNGDLCIFDTDCAIADAEDYSSSTRKCYTLNSFNVEVGSSLSCSPYDFDFGESGRCECAQLSGPFDNSTSKLRACPTSGCDSGEVCVRDTRTNFERCVSCGALAQRVYFVPVEPDVVNKTCKSASLPPIPALGMGANGKTRDLCNHDSACNHTAGLRCLTGREGDDGCPQYGGCKCLPEDLEAKVCHSSSQCSIYEACVAVMSLEAARCYSLGFGAENAPRDEVKILDPQGIIQPPQGYALTGDSCSYDWDCTPPRRCQHIMEPQFGRCAGRRNCFCQQIIPMACATDTDCDEGEHCANVLDAHSKPFCTSNSSIANNPLLHRVPLSEDIMTPEPSESIKLAGESCRTDNECRSGTLCQHVTEEFPACEGRRGCVCTPTAGCQSSANCTSGESCYVVGDSSVNVTEPACLSLSIQSSSTLISYSEIMDAETTTGTEAEEKTDADSSKCVDARALSHLSARDLVFDRPGRLASVLCDAQGSCATPGHLVEWDGRHVLMRTYCETMAHGGCVRRTMTVNSPAMKWSKRIRVDSLTRGLSYTPFAARFESRTEESFLRVLVRAGGF